MSKKTKRNKGRKGNSVDSTSSKRGRDSVTGLYMDVGGEKLLSDTIYGQLSANGQGPFKEFEQYEFEFGKDAIALTFTGGSENWKRYTLMGEFKYDKKGKMTSAKTWEFADWTHSPTSEWITVFQKATTKSSPYEIFTGFEGNELYNYDSNLETRGLSDTPRSGFNSFDSSKYFENGWWDNPFATNLI